MDYLDVYAGQKRQKAVFFGKKTLWFGRRNWVCCWKKSGDSFWDCFRSPQRFSLALRPEYRFAKVLLVRDFAVQRKRLVLDVFFG